MYLIHNINSKTIITPIVGNEIQYKRDYTYNRKWIIESINLINQALSKISYDRKLTQISITALKNPYYENHLLQMRNWSVYYLSSNKEEDLKEFYNALHSFQYTLTIE